MQPSATLASLHALRPAYGRPQRVQCYRDVCMTMDSVIGSVLPRFRLQRFIGKGISQIVYVEGKIHQSTFYAGRGQPLLHRVQSQGVSW